MTRAHPGESGALTRNTTWLVAGRLASHAFSIAVTVVVARGLGSTGFGQFAFVVAIVVIGNVVTTFGTDSLLIREIAAQQGEAGYLVTEALALQIALSAVVILLVVAGAGWLPGRTEDTVEALRLFVVSLFPLAVCSVCSAVLRAWERMDLSALLTVSTSALQAVVALVVVRAGFDLPNLMVALLFAQTLAAGLAWFLCRVARPGFRLALSAAALAPAALGHVFTRAWSLALLGGFTVLSQRIGVLLLTFLAGDSAAGWFAAAMRVVEGLKVAHYSLMGALSPMASRMAAEGMSGPPIATDQLIGLVHKSRLVLLAFGVGAALVATLAAGPVTTILYGHAYGPAADALRILAWVLVPFAVAAPTGMALVSTGHERVVVRTAALGVSVTVAVGALLIPTIGVNGASTAVIVGESARCVLLLAEQGRITAPRFAPNAAA